MFDPKDLIWTEKYRPDTVKDIVGDFKDKIMKHLGQPKAIPNFLFYSKSPGTGKTTLAKAIINDLGCDKLIINSSDDRKIDVIREKVKKFAITQSSNPDVKRCIFLDEVDGMLKASQDALRNIMETYASNVFFIFTCNSIIKVIEPLRSRCLTLSFAYPKKEEVYNYLVGVCEKENMKYSEEGIKELIEINYPSIRNCILALQDLHIQELDVVIDNVKSVDEAMEVLWGYLKEKRWKDIKTEIMQTNIDPRELNMFFWKKALDNSNIRLIQLTCKNERDIALGADPKVIVVSSLIELVK